MMTPMTQSLIFVGLFVVLLALAPVGLKWAQRRIGGKGAGVTPMSRIISAVAVGPHQRVVTVEVGPEGARIWLTLGVTAQSITCLHSATVEVKSETGSKGAASGQAEIVQYGD
jgi:flagellar protein FliO/FliZ